MTLKDVQGFDQLFALKVHYICLVLVCNTDSENCHLKNAFSRLVVENQHMLYTCFAPYFKKKDHLD